MRQTWHLKDDARGAACREITNPNIPCTNDTHRVTCKSCKSVIADWEAAGYERWAGAWTRVREPSWAGN